MLSTATFLVRKGLHPWRRATRFRGATAAGYVARDVGKPARHSREEMMIRSIEQTTMRKVYLRVLPIAALSYFFCYLDRINVGFAALTMNKHLGLEADQRGGHPQ